MILVTGGTGLVGSHLLYFLLKENSTVKAIHRSSSDLNAVKKVFSYYTETSTEAKILFNKIEWLEANLLDIPALTEAFDNVTIVYHAAAYVDFNPKNYYKLKKSNQEGTANIVNLSLANNIEKLYYVSTVATLGSTTNGTLINEETQWNPEDKQSVYSLTKYGAEMEVWRGTQEGLTAVVVNPGVILGEGFWHQGSGAIIKQAAKGIPFYFPGGIGIVDVQDVVRIMIALTKSNIENEQFVLVGANISYQNLLSSIAKGLGKKAPTKETPRWVLNLLSSLDWFISSIFGTKRRLMKATVRSLFTTSYYDAGKVKQELDIEFTPFKETVERVTNAYSTESSSSSVT